MSFTGIDSLDRSIDKTKQWLSDIAASFGTEDRRFAYRVARAWLHTLRDRLPVQVAAHFAAQLPELLRGVFYDGWHPGQVPVKYGRAEYIARFARDARVHDSEVPQAASLVTGVVRCHASDGVVDEVLAVLPADICQVLETKTAGLAAELDGVLRGAVTALAPGGVLPRRPVSAEGGSREAVDTLVRAVRA